MKKMRASLLENQKGILNNSRILNPPSNQIINKIARI
jgi:hypothetical protein